MNNNGFSKLAVDEVKNSEDFFQRCLVRNI